MWEFSIWFYSDVDVRMQYSVLTWYSGCVRIHSSVESYMGLNIQCSNLNQYRCGNVMFNAYLVLVWEFNIQSKKYVDLRIHFFSPKVIWIWKLKIQCLLGTYSRAQYLVYKLCGCEKSLFSPTLIHVWEFSIQSYTDTYIKIQCFFFLDCFFSRLTPL